MNNRIKIIEDLKNSIDQLSPRKEWNDKFIEKVKLDFTFYNNKLENNALSYGQTIRYLKEAVSPKGASVKDCLDVKNHFEVLDIVFKTYTKPLSENALLELHGSLMKNHLQWDEGVIYLPGKYKTGINYTVQSSGKLIQYLDSEKVPAAIKELIEEINLGTENSDPTSIEKHPVKIASLFHTRFLEIHPFEDGNGRICRIFTNLILLKTGYAPVFIKPTDRMMYLNLFENALNKENRMLDFFINQLIESLHAKLDFITKAQEGTSPN